MLLLQLVEEISIFTNPKSSRIRVNSNSNSSNSSSSNSSNSQTLLNPSRLGTTGGRGTSTASEAERERRWTSNMRRSEYYRN